MYMFHCVGHVWVLICVFASLAVCSYVCASMYACVYTGLFVCARSYWLARASVYMFVYSDLRVSVCVVCMVVCACVCLLMWVVAAVPVRLSVLVCVCVCMRFVLCLCGLSDVRLIMYVCDA